MKDIRYIFAIKEALEEEMERDENVLLIGEDVGLAGGSFGASRDLFKKFGPRRVVDTPISEASLTSMAAGAASCGLRPVVEIMFMDFVTCAMDSIVNQIAKMRYMFGNQFTMPIVVRMPEGAGLNAGPQHSQCLEAWFAHVPGLKVVMAANPFDVKGLLKSAIRDDDTVCVMENTLLYGEKWEVPEGEYLIPLGKADLKRVGKDLSFIAHGRAVITCLKAAEVLMRDHGIDAEVLDLRSIRPLDEQAILETVAKTGRVVLVDENKPFCGVGAQIASLIADRAFDSLDAPVKRVSSLDAPQIYAKPLEDLMLPTVERIVATALSIC